jgi:hypothetical protein
MKILNQTSFFLLLSTVSCATVVGGTPLGIVYTSVKGPVAVTSYEDNTKKGRSCATSILGVVATGDAGIEAAKNNGGIKKVASVSRDITSILGIFAEVCTVVAGN